MRTKHRAHTAHANKFSLRFGDRRLLAYAGLVVAILGAYCVFHFRAGYSFPLPWPDEAHFLWQSNGFAQHWSLFAPELNPDRTIFWMPPAYFIILGIVIKIFGLSLMVGRNFSLVLMMGAICLLAALVWRYRWPFLSLILAVPFVLGSPFVACGNIARMEALLIAVLLLAFWMIQQRRLVAGLCLLMFLPLIHPNGVYFLLSGTVAVLLLWPRPWRLRRPTNAEGVMVALVILAWLGYILYASLHWTDFVRDMSFQFQRKLARDVGVVLLAPFSLAMVGLMLVAAIYGYLNRLKLSLLLAIVIPAWWVAAYGIEMWYRVFFALSFYLLGVVCVNIVQHVLQTEEVKIRRYLESAILGCVAVGVIGWNVIVASFGESLAYPDPRAWYGMSIGYKSYIGKQDISALRSILSAIPRKDHVPIVEFYPAADAFLFTNPRADIQHSYPLFCERQADWYVVHLSTRFTPPLNTYAQELLDKLKVDSRELGKSVVYLRDSTEQWFLISDHMNR